VKFSIFNFQSPIYKQPAWWFWAAIFIGLAIRIYFVVFTEGTCDVLTWQSHAAGIQEKGLIGYYRANEDMNHPPFIGIVMSWLLSISKISGIPFRILFRGIFTLLDAGTAILLLYSFCESRYRFLIAAGYWLHPLAIIYSAYHGNTDSSVAFFLMLCVYLLSKEKVIWSGVVLGMGLWIKLPGLIAVPALVFFLPHWKERLRFLLTAGIVGISTYLPTLFADPAIIYKNVFRYQGNIIVTTARTPTWGTLIFLMPFFDNLPLYWQIKLGKPLVFLMNNGVWPAIGLIVFLCWLRRSKRTIRGLGLSIAAAYTVLYGFSNNWSFQYFAWSVPFWFFAPPVFLFAATFLTGGYIYSLYWLLCGNPWLLGEWDFLGHPYWPRIIEMFRNGSLLFFIFGALVFLVAGIYSEAGRLYNRLRSCSSGK
jgi:hypothetical protein